MKLKFFFALLVLAAPLARADDVPYFIPQLLGAQYTGVDQHQYALRSPYAGPLSLLPQGDTERTHTFGAYFGVQLPANFQFYADIEKFDGEGVSGATGMGGLTNGDVVRSGSVNLPKRPYFARHYLRYVIALGDSVHALERAQDQLPAHEADTRLEFKFGKFAVNDDFDKNRYANAARTQFMNWSLWNNTAWDFAADTRGYTNGLLAAYVTPTWALRYGVFQMPREANGQTLEWPLGRASGENLELTLQPAPDGWALRMLAFRNIARMGIYRDALAVAHANGTVPDIHADDHDGRRKYGLGANFELPLADSGDTGVFARWGWNDGKTESFAFTEVDRTFSAGAQFSGVHWGRPQDRLAAAIAIDGLSATHRDYLAAGGCGFLLCDGRLDYAREQVAEVYYAFQPTARATLSPDLQYIRNPGYNRDRGPAKFLGARIHLEL